MNIEPDRTPFDKFYVNCLAKTIFYINIGAASTLGQFYLSRLLLDYELFNIIVASTWAAILIAVYAFIQAKDKEQFAKLKTEHFNLKMIRSDAPISRPTDTKPAKSSKDAKPVVSKIEIQHTMDPNIPQEKLPAFLRKDAAQ